MLDINRSVFLSFIFLMVFWTNGFSQFLGGSNDGHSMSDINPVSCPMPGLVTSYSNVFLGGSNDGHALSDINPVVCPMPDLVTTYTNVFLGGSNDGHALSDINPVVCPMPGLVTTYTNVFLGGSNDGHALSNINPVICSMPGLVTTYTNIFLGGKADGASVDSSLKCINYTGCKLVASGSNDTSICPGNTITLTAGGGMNYLWTIAGDTNSIGTTSSITVTPGNTTTYSVAISDTTCTLNKIIKVTVNTLNAVSVSGKTVICTGDSSILTASGGTSYEWSGGETTSSITVKPVQDISYTVKIGNGCSDTALTVPVTIFTGGSVSISGDTVICTGTSTTLKAKGGPGYKWSTGGTTETITVAPLADTDYKVVVTNGACIDSSSISVKVTAPPTVSAGGDKDLCQGSSVQLDGSGTGSIYRWSPATGLSDTTVLTPLATPAITTDYILSISNGLCARQDTVTVSISTINATISGNTSLCMGDSTTLTTSGGTNYLWNTGDTTESITIKPAQDTTATVIITNGASCMASVEIKVGSYPTNVSAGTDKMICEGESVQIDGNGIGNSYLWMPSSGLDQDTIMKPTASPSNTTDYILTVANGSCLQKDTVKITVNPLPVITTADTSINKGTSATITVTSTGNYTYTWTSSPDLSCITCQSPVVTPSETSTYYIIATSIEGCKNSDSVTVKVIEPECEVYVPNAFSPNGDGQNDFLKIHGDCIKGVQFTIYDRWGEKVYETTDISIAMMKGWDGTYKGKELNSAVFVYYLNYTLKDEEIKEKNGNITLIR